VDSHVGSDQGEGDDGRPSGSRHRERNLRCAYPWSSASRFAAAP